jgi:hypothetical protein
VQAIAAVRRPRLGRQNALGRVVHVSSCRPKRLSGAGTPSSDRDGGRSWRGHLDSISRNEVRARDFDANRRET